jgi:hypothetical protein
MADFSSFFPTAGAGGGGFTNMRKYSTARSLNDATHKLKLSVSGIVSQTLSGGGQTSFNWQSDSLNSGEQAIVTVQDALVGYTFNIGYGTQTVTGNTGAGFGSNQTLSFTPAIGGGVSYGTVCDLNAPSTFTVNPATDLGLSDGDSIGYFLCGAGYSGHLSSGGRGGKITSGTAIITNASTDLVLTPGVANGANSTITGGLTLSSGNGSNASGFGDFNQNNVVCFAAGSGVMGYGVGGGQYSGYRNAGQDYHGYGVGGYQTGGAGDGAILLYY